MKKNILLLLMSITLLFIHQRPLKAELWGMNDEIEIQLAGDTPAEFCSTSTDCTGEVSINFEVTGACLSGETVVTAQIDLFRDGVNDGAVTVEGVFPNFVITETYGIGAHRFILNAEDGCGNMAVLNIDFQVVDCEISTPNCLSGLVFSMSESIQQGTSLKIYATDFLPEGDTIIDCSGLLGYSIHKDREIADGTDVPAYPHPFIEQICCEDNSAEIVRIYVWDNAFNPYAVQPDGTVGGSNYAYCESYYLVEDMEVLCECFPLGSINGYIETADGRPMEGVSVILSGDVSMSQVTDSLGNYSFEGLTPGTDVTITPQLDEFPQNGVSTFDLVLIAKHILGIQSLDDPLKMIAADVSGSGSISTIDLIQLRKLILGLYDEFPSNTSWRFVDANYVFPEDADLGAFPETFSFNNINTDELIVDFIGVKIGDVNDSVVLE